MNDDRDRYNYTPPQAPFRRPQEAPPQAPLRRPQEAPLQAPLRSSRETTPPHAWPHSPPPVPPVRRRRQRRGTGGAAVLIVFCLIISGAAGFAGGYLANATRPLPATATDPPPMFRPETIAQEPVVVFPSGTSEHAADESEAGISLTESEPEADNALSETDTQTDSTGRRTPDASEVATTVRQSVVEIKIGISSAGGMAGSRAGDIGSGSGVIISEDGYIVTNNHVINGATSITVRLSDGREYPAELISTDVRTDVAVLKISESGLTAAVFGDSTELSVGEGALAVGNPLGELGGTVTSGIISALDRDIVVEGQIMTLLQTDAAVNPGNSGGGLFNMNGELIGVVVAKSGGINIEGLGFAIPSNTARSVIDDLLEHGFVRGRAVVAGLELIDVQTTQSARAHRVNYLGLYIFNSPDDRLLRGDRITAVGNRGITNQISFDSAMRSLAIGDAVDITVARGDQSVTISVTLSEWRPDNAWGP